MFTPISKRLGVALLLTALAGCGGDAGSPTQDAGKKADNAALDGKVQCALAGSDTFQRICSTEQITANGGIMLIIRNPDGGFRRFNILTDGRGLAAADGFDETRIDLREGSMIELTSGDDRYLLPAQIKTSDVTNQTPPAKDAS